MTRLMGKPSRFNWVLVVAVCSYGTAAHAEEPVAQAAVEASEIQLKNGGLMRGTIVAVEPGQRVIVIVAGEQSVIPWNDIAKIVGGPTETSPSAPATTIVEATPPPAAAKGMPTLHIESTWPELELSRIDGDIGAGMYYGRDQVSPQTLSKYVCRAPCDKPIDGRDGHRFFITGPGMMPTPQFRLDSYDGHVTARVHGASLGRFTSGVILAASGGMFGLGGLMFVGMSYIPQEPSEDDPNPGQTAREVRTIGAVMAGVGVAMAITGAVLLSGGRTRVELIKSNRGDAKLVLDHGVLRF